MKLSDQPRIRAPRGANVTQQDWEDHAEALQERLDLREGEIKTAKQGASWLAVIITAVLFLGLLGFAGYTTRELKHELATSEQRAQRAESALASTDADAKAKATELVKVNNDLSAAKTAKDLADKAKAEAEKATGEVKTKLADETKAKEAAEKQATEVAAKLVDAEQKLADAEKKITEAAKPAIDINAAIAEAVARVKSELTRTPAPAPVVPNVIVNHLPTATVAPASPVVAKHSPDVLRRMLARDARVSSSPVGGLITKLLSGSFVADPHGASILEEASAQAAKVANDPNRDVSTRNYASEDAAALKGAAEALRAGSGAKAAGVKQPLPPLVKKQPGGQPVRR